MPVKYPYSYALKKVPDLLKHVRTANVPQGTVNRKYLETAGFTSSYDATLIPVMKFVGLLESDGKAGEAYRKYRDEQNGDKHLGDLIAHSYSDLYHMYPQAHTLDRATLQNFFKNDADVSAEVADRIANTFLALCDRAIFSNGDKPLPASNSSGSREEPAPHDLPTEENGPKRSANRVEVCVNVQVMIPENANPAMVDSIFASMAKHLKIG